VKACTYVKKIPTPLHVLTEGFGDLYPWVMRRFPKAVREALAELGRIGGKKGGPKGGRARAQRMTPEERREAARRAVQARWAKAKQKRRVVPS